MDDPRCSISPRISFPALSPTMIHYGLMRNMAVSSPPPPRSTPLFLSFFILPSRHLGSAPTSSRCFHHAPLSSRSFPHVDRHTSCLLLRSGSVALPVSRSCLHRHHSSSISSFLLSLFSIVIVFSLVSPTLYLSARFYHPFLPARLSRHCPLYPYSPFSLPSPCLFLPSSLLDPLSRVPVSISVSPTSTSRNLPFPISLEIISNVYERRAAETKREGLRKTSPTNFRIDIYPLHVLLVASSFLQHVLASCASLGAGGV